MKEGTLYVIATPIGNLEDITLRALSVLRDEVEVIYCEDTRQTRKLLQHYGIKAPAYALHAHSSDSVIERVIRTLKEGRSVAYMTDSGTPAISDPGSKLVSRVRLNGLTVSPLPGASAVSSILSVCGFPEKEFHFAGFLSKKEGRRLRELETLRTCRSLIILYESPYRIKKLLKAVSEIFPGREILIGREMTKLHEEFIAGSIEEIMQNLDTLKEKGEFTVLIHNGSHARYDEEGGTEEDEEGDH